MVKNQFRSKVRKHFGNGKHEDEDLCVKKILKHDRILWEDDGVGISREKHVEKLQILSPQGGKRNHKKTQADVFVKRKVD
jgi:hypothetical protein